MGDSVFVNGRAAVHKGSSGKSVASPDVCLCPPGPPAGPIPAPLVNTVVAADMDGGAPSVQVEGNPQGTRQSFFKKSSGNEVARATGGGVLTGVVQGQARFGFGYSRNVWIEGEPAVRHLDPLTHNHAGPSGNTPPALWVSTVDPSVPRLPPTTVVKDIGNGPERIEVTVLDEAGYPAATRFEVQTPDGRTHFGSLLGGASVVLLGLSPGECRWRFPDVDERCRLIKRTSPAEVSEPSWKPYQASSALGIAVGAAYRVVVPGMVTLFVEVVVRPGHGTNLTDRFVLRSTDGAYQLSRELARPARGRDRNVYLEFWGLLLGRQYSLIHHPAEGGTPYEIFSGEPLSRLVPGLQDAGSSPLVQPRFIGR